MALSRKQLHIILTEVINFNRPGGRRRFREVDASGIEWRSIDPSPSLFRLRGSNRMVSESDVLKL